MNGRVPAIDVLRGVTMALLAGGAALVSLLLQSLCGEVPPQIAAQLVHAEWGRGFTCWDMLMPLFIFLSGASVPFAFAKYQMHYGPEWRQYARWRVLRRTVLLFVLGMAVQGHLLTFHPEQMSLYCNTLQAIAVGYLVTAMAVSAGGLRMQGSVVVALLVVYGLLLLYMPYNGHEGGHFLPKDNAAYYVDCLVLGRWQDGTVYTWLLSSFSFGALALMGAMGGQVLQRLPMLTAALALTAAGLICLAAAQLLQGEIPPVKHIFSPTMVLWSGGWCLLLLALFHLIFDITPRTYALGLPFYAFGSNALLAYLLTNLPGEGGYALWWGIAHPLLGGFAGLFGAHSDMVFRLSSFLLLWGVLEILRRHRCLLRV